MEPFVEIFPGRVLRILEPSSAAAIETQWMNTFCHNKQGVNTRQYKWHIFSSGRYEALEGKLAVDAYERHSATEFFVLSNSSQEVIVTDLRPQALSGTDCYVFPVNMAWTMAFTHEEDRLGPYFAKHRQYDRLEADNARLVKKQQQKEQAIKNGWL
ncbi:DUF4275 family protein [Reinekea blandensis]|uniref:Uncharacterized protein n=1 Tax=Reinekea blandensis MED297 TaxID=314283 RepID=A4BDL6_9GAMM|nr:DUF4275 family protein [Reinekea blandensis]EAR09960.1 hypothetical protein MED297_06409 [Reinekea sp. MED297] [Reinekea blandensis MED297]